MQSIPEGFRGWVDGAECVKTSGRWTSANDQIKALCAVPGADNKWLVQLLASLCFMTFSEYNGLKHAFDNRRNNDVSLLAWRARNLLELSIWAHYCAKGKDKARRLYEDAGRDANDFYKLFIRWGQENGMSPEWIENIDAAQSDLVTRAQLERIDAIDGAYMPVVEAAREIGFETQFRI